RVDKEMSAEARQDFAAFVPDGDVGAFAAGLPRALKSAFMPAMSTLRNQSFQDLLATYKRKPRVFLVSEGTQDEVTSSWRPRRRRQGVQARRLSGCVHYVRAHAPDRYRRHRDPAQPAARL